ncbi:hypothetical protein [Pseudotabrizicola algicola]|uniref:DUF3618 domain-containing protein n=1 Tax=Pseudotabrizicola algicola TaxID=2709381 RepID=A0A6B3RR83_9RHOB|nr:hypothetical protein [Pseudotabrizicola algicola]NEX46485.1 hypothetical protein [Pseudotabrizicola algicola]
MSDRAQHLENEIEAHRAGVEETLDKLKNRLSVDQMVDDVGHFLGVENVRETLHSAGRQVRENPMALALIGAGVAWLMMGKSQTSTHDPDDWRGESDTGYGGRSGDHWQSYSGGQDKLHDDDSSLAGKAMASVSDLGETLGEVPHMVRDAMGRAVEGVQSSVDTVKERAGSTVRPLTRSVSSQPLLVGAATFAMGAIMGSALPRTRTEDRLLGPQRQKMWTAAYQATGEMGERVTEAAKTTYAAAAEAARKEGLMPDGKGTTLAEKVEHVAQAAVDTAAEQIDPILHGDGVDSGADKDNAGKDSARKSKASGI